MAEVEVVRHEYGPEGGRYIRAQLEMSWKALGSMLATCDVEAAETWAFVPGAAPVVERGRLETGLFTIYGGRQLPRMSTWLAEQLHRDGERALVCFEHPLAAPTDPFLNLERHQTRPLFFSGDSVYPYWQGEASEEEAEDLLHWVTHYPAIGFLGRSDQRIEPRSAIGPPELETLAASARTLIVGAYDAEGYVVCELP